MTHNIKITATVLDKSEEFDMPKGGVALVLEIKVGDKSEQIGVVYTKEDLESSDKKQVLHNFSRQIELLNERIQEGILGKKL